VFYDFKTLIDLFIFFLLLQINFDIKFLGSIGMFLLLAWEFIVGLYYVFQL